MLSQKATNLKNLFKDYEDCQNCNYCSHGSKVFGCGNIDAEVCVVGEGPGEEEVNQGIPFVGPAGQLLDKILASVNISRDSTYVTNAMICRTNEKNRTPTFEEQKNCRDRLCNELDIIKPKVTILTGSIALQSIFGKDHKITNYHGKWMTLLSEPCYFYFPIYHPAWILHSSSEGETKARKQIMWDDMKFFRDSLEIVNSIET
jgi:uracil-DNA glycosylase